MKIVCSVFKNSKTCEIDALLNGRIEELYLLLAGSPRPELRSPSLAQLVLRLELPQLMLGDRLGSEESGCS